MCILEKLLIVFFGICALGANFFRTERLFAYETKEVSSNCALNVNMRSEEHRTHKSDRRDLVMERSIAEQYVRIVDKKIFYLETVGDDEIPVVFVHGNFASSKWFEPALKILPSGLKGYAIDLPNFGRSDRLEEVSIDNYANYVINFILEMELDGVVLVGHSLGGAVAQSAVIKRPDLIDRVILVDPAPPDGLKTPEEVYPYLEMYRGNRELLKKALIGVMPTREVDEFLEQLVDEALLMDGRCFVENARALEKYDFTEALSEIEVPHLVVVGKLDNIVTEEMARRFERILRDVEIRVLPDYGHSVILEDTELFVKILEDFVER